MALNSKLWITVALFRPCVVAQTTVSNLEWENFNLVNKLRADGFTCPKGKTFAPNAQALVFDCQLWRAGYLHSKDMADNKYFSHTSQDGKSPWDRAPSAYAENIAQGSSTAKQALDQWKNSDAHCKNIGDPTYKSFGVGQYKGYWTQMFGMSAGTDKSCYPSGATAGTGTAATTVAATAAVPTPIAPTPSPSPSPTPITTTPGTTQTLSPAAKYGVAQQQIADAPNPLQKQVAGVPNPLLIIGLFVSAAIVAIAFRAVRKTRQTREYQNADTLDSESQLMIE